MGIIILFDRDKANAELREDMFQICTRLHIVTPKAAQITDNNAGNPPGSNIIHQPVERWPVKDGSSSPVISIDVGLAQIRASPDVFLTYSNLCFQRRSIVILAAVLHGKTGIYRRGVNSCVFGLSARFQCL